MKLTVTAIVALLASTGLAQYGGGGSPNTPTTTTLATKAATSSSASSSAAAAASTPSGVHVVEVSDANSALQFTPNSITAAMGDQVEFVFNPLNHSVIQAAFDNPCMPSTGGFFSGFMPVAMGASTDSRPTFTLTINSTDPIWFYCGQTIESHCQAGMVGVINPPSSGGNTLAAFKTAAGNTKQSVVPADVQGGSISTFGKENPVSSNSSSSSAGSSSASSAAASTSASASSKSSEAGTVNFSLVSAVIAMVLPFALF